VSRYSVKVRHNTNDTAASISFKASFMNSNKEQKSVPCSTAFKREKFKVLNMWKKAKTTPQKRTKTKTKQNTHTNNLLSFALGKNLPLH